MCLSTTCSWAKCSVNYNCQYRKWPTKISTIISFAISSISSQGVSSVCWLSVPQSSVSKTLLLAHRQMHTTAQNAIKCFKIRKNPIKSTKRRISRIRINRSINVLTADSSHRWKIHLSSRKKVTAISAYWNK